MGVMIKLNSLRVTLISSSKETFYFIKPHVTKSSLLLNKLHEFIMVLMKLCLIVSHQDIASF